jgi:hypothetical protein
MLIMVRVVMVSAEIKCKIKRDDDYSPPNELERAPPPCRARALMFRSRRAYASRFTRLFTASFPSVRFAFSLHKESFR